MRTITCDRCGHSENFNDNETIKRVDFYCIVASGTHHARAERKLQFDLCENCRPFLPDLYDRLADMVEEQILTWIGKENAEK